MRNRVIVSIGLAAVLAVMMCPLLAEESDGVGDIYYFYADGERIGQCYSDDIIVPEPPEKEGMEFYGWTVNGIYVDPYTYESSGTTSFYAQYLNAPEPDRPGMEADIFVIACIIAAVALMAVSWYFATR